MPPPLDLDRLADELTPVRRLRPAAGALATAAAVAAVIVAVLGWAGLRADLAEGVLHPIFLVRAGLLLLLGSASVAGVLAMGQPAVGRARAGWRWAAAAAAVIRMAAVILALNAPTPVGGRLYPMNGMQCIGYTLVGGIAIGAVLTLWLRRGAPTSPKRAGLLVGLGAGSLAAFAYGMHCPHDDMLYIGLWYTIAIAGAAAIGWIVVPPLVRW